MRALFALVSANLRKSLYLAAFMPIISWANPAVLVHASDGANSALVFEVKPNQNQNSGNIQTQSLLTYDQLLASDPLVTQVVEYIKKKAPNSPLAKPEIVAKLIQHTDLTHDRTVWMRALAISLVESHMCTHTPKVRAQGKVIESHNCSGIRSGKGYRMYASYADWFTDMTNLLLKPNYINRPINKYLRFYVYPGSANWLNGVTKVESDLLAIEAQAKQERIALANSIPVHTSIFGFELAFK